MPFLASVQLSSQAKALDSASSLYEAMSAIFWNAGIISRHPLSGYGLIILLCRASAGYGVLYIFKVWYCGI